MNRNSLNKVSIGLMVFSLFCTLGVAVIHGQSNTGSATGTDSVTAPPRSLPRGFGDYQLGEQWEDFQDILERRAHFEYRGNPDVSLLSQPNTSLIDVRGHTFFSRGTFQFSEGLLTVITLNLDPQQFDWFMLYSTLEERYGLPDYLDPRLARWEDGITRMSLEKPLTLRYIDLESLNNQEVEEHDNRTFQSLIREQFLEQL